MEATIPARPVPVVRLIVPDLSGRVLIRLRALNSTDGGKWRLQPLLPVLCRGRTGAER
jgi:hypothetical protein